MDRQTSAPHTSQPTTTEMSHVRSPAEPPAPKRPRLATSILPALRRILPSLVSLLGEAQLASKCLCRRWRAEVQAAAASLAHADAVAAIALAETAAAAAYLEAANASAMLSAVDPRSLMRLHAIEIQLVMQRLDARSLVSLGRCSRLLKRHASDAFAWEGVPPLEVRMAALQPVRSADSSLVARAPLSLVLDDDYCRELYPTFYTVSWPVENDAIILQLPPTQQHALTDLRVVELQWSGPFAVEQLLWRALFLQPLAHLRSVKVLVEASAELVANVCALPHLTSLYVLASQAAHGASIARSSLTSLELVRCKTWSTSQAYFGPFAPVLQKVFASSSLARTLLRLEMSEDLSTDTALTNIGRLAALHTIVIVRGLEEHWRHGDSLSRDAALELGECPSLRHIIVRDRWQRDHTERLLSTVGNPEREWHLGAVLKYCPQVLTYTLEFFTDAEFTSIDASTGAAIAAIRSRLQARALAVNSKLAVTVHRTWTDADMEAPYIEDVAATEQYERYAAANANSDSGRDYYRDHLLTSCFKSL
jgi:hypothetical protein